MGDINYECRIEVLTQLAYKRWCLPFSNPLVVEQTRDLIAYFELLH